MESMAYLTVEIKGTKYGVETLTAADSGNRVVRISKADCEGTTYDVEQGMDRTTCTCPDYQRRHADLPYSNGCKHVKALVQFGLIVNALPWAKTEPEPEIGVSGAGVEPNATEAVPVAVAPPTEGEDRPTSTRANASVNLVSKYRPTTLGDLVGQDEAVFQLREWVEAPSETAFLFWGDTGIGKTSAALALASDLGVDVAEGEWGGLYQIAAGNQLAEDVREVIRNLAIRPMSGSGWKVLIVNECDRMSEAVAYIWLDALENLPPQSVVIFSTNHVEKLPRRFVTRCESYQFKAGVDAIGEAVQAFVNRVWFAETGRTDAPQLETIGGAVEDGMVSIRGTLQGMNPLVRRARLTPPIRQASASVKVNVQTTGSANVNVKVDAGQVDVNVETNEAQAELTAEQWEAYGRRYAAGESRSKLAKEAGVKQTKFWNQVNKLGYLSPKKHYSPPKAKVAV